MSESTKDQGGKHRDGTPGKRRRVIKNDEYIAMLQRMIRGLERRVIDDPQMLAHVIMLGQQLAEVPNVVIATSAARYAMNRYAAPSAGEIARLLDMKKQSAADRRKIGDRVLAERALGVEPMAQRERAARTKATTYAEEMLASWLERRDSEATL